MSSVTLSLAVFSTLCTVAAGVTYFSHRRERAKQTLRARWHKGLCDRCGYDVRASPGRCPECGAKMPTIDCPACHGQGWVQVEVDVIDCSHCGTRGKVFEPQSAALVV